jgi:hypothetical protein
LIHQLGRPFTVGAGSLKIQVVSAKGKALVDLVYKKRMWTKFEKPSSEVRENRLTEAVVKLQLPQTTVWRVLRKRQHEMLQVAVVTSPKT